ncbi:MAG: hypothetical protein ACQKBV_05480 [Puniceicoccales bacterium]
MNRTDLLRGTMLLKRLTATIIAANVVIAPIHAHAAPLGTVGSTNTHIAAPAGNASELGDDDDNGTIFILLGLLLIAGGVYVATKGGDDDEDLPPVSF